MNKLKMTKGYSGIYTGNSMIRNIDFVLVSFAAI